jgi:hypothetical protein
MPWAPDIPAALVLLAIVLGMFAPDIYELVWESRFFSAERKRIANVSRWWRERAR